MKIQDASLMTTAQIAANPTQQLPTGFTGDKAVTIEKLTNYALNQIGFGPLFDSVGQAIQLTGENLSTLESNIVDYATSGLYYADTTCTNGPVAATAGLMLWLRGDINEQTQVFHTTTAALYVRKKHSGTWGGWLFIQSSTSSFTQGSVIFAGASSLAQDNSNLYFDDTNNFLGVGNNVPRSSLHVVSSTASGFRDIMLEQNIASTASPTFYFLKSRGSFGTPGIITAGDALGQISFRGYNNASYANSAQIDVVSGTVVGAGLVSGIMNLRTTNSGSGTSNIGLTIDDSQIITIPHYTTANALLYTNGSGVVSQATVGSLPGLGSGWGTALTATYAAGWSSSGSTTITSNTNQSGAFVNTFNLNSVSITQNVLTGASGSANPALIVIGGVNTALTAGTQAYDINFALSRIVQFSTGALAAQHAVTVGAPIYAFVGASTITEAATFEIVGAPTAGTNASITNSHTLILNPTSLTTSITNSYGLTVNANTGATNNYSAQFMGGIGLKFSQASQSTSHTFFSITQASHTGGTPYGLIYSSGSQSTLAASVEIFDININLGTTRQFNTGAHAGQRSVVMNAPLYSFVGASTMAFANALTLIQAPIAGTNATITDSAVLNISSSTVISGGVVTNSWGLLCSAPSGATNNYAAKFTGGSGVLVNHLGNSVIGINSIVAGTGAGTSPTVSVTGGDLDGVISITTGTGSPAATAIIATITFAAAYAIAPKIVIYPANRAARDLAIGAWPIVPANGQTNGVGTTTFVLESGTALATATTYLWAYHILQ